MVNVSEGRDPAVLAELAVAAGALLLDLHADPDHHRCVLTMAGAHPLLEDAVRRVARRAADLLSLERHEGAHPRLGVVDVVPFVPLPPQPVPAPGAMALAAAAADRYCAWSADELGIPCFRYGTDSAPAGGREAPAGAGRASAGGRSLPEVRRRAFEPLLPDTGPPRPHPRWGATAVGARAPLVAFNLWLSGATPAVARAAAAAIRGPHVRALGFALAAGVQVSCNLVAPFDLGPGAVYERVRRALDALGAHGITVARCELVGLVPAAVLDAEPEARWTLLDLAPSRTIEGRLGARGLS